MAYFWKDLLRKKKAQLAFSLRNQDVWFATRALWCLPRPRRGGDLIIEDVLRAKKWLFEIQDVHEEQIESHHGKEREDGQAGAKASPGAARVQADPVNESVGDQKTKTNRKSDQVQTSLMNSHSFSDKCFMKLNMTSLTRLEEFTSFI